MYSAHTFYKSAKECIMIQDWWLSPELYLRRPPAKFPEYRIDRLLKKKASEGVRIYIIVYKVMKCVGNGFVDLTLDV
ncbi:hypothetical protein FRC14_007690 [Serendipita sp. 396]|nr:hypothetical protein FRC14_007690 [Serendipita sp. 396]KAG8868995.1 hypothetical protein FRC20_002350 [Serendipita sp. 405]